MRSQRAAVRWSKHHRKAIERHAVTAYPQECCGLLFGVETAAGWWLKEVHPATNVSQAPHKGYELDGREQAAAMRHADARQLLLIGYYHSHPNGRQSPSPADFVLAGGDPATLPAGERAKLPRDLHNLPERRLPDHSLHLIVAVENGRPLGISAWWMRHDLSGFDEVDLEP